MYQNRLHRLQKQIVAHGLDGVALVPGVSMLYFSGINAHLMERPTILFIPADDDPAMIIPVLEMMKAEAAGIAPERIFAYSDEEGYLGAFQQACARLELTDYLLGVEAFRMRVIEFELLRRYAPGLQTAHAEAVLMSLRGVKDATELAAMKTAVDIAEKAVQRLLPRIKVGQTERQIAAMLTQELLSAGAQGVPFEPIVAAGPNSAVPHAVPTNRPIQEGDLLLIDWGAMYDHYASDITRTFAVGTIDDELVLVYEAVKAANAAGRAACRPETLSENIDHATRTVITAAGFGDFFIHRTGHGLGMEGHEPPSIVAGDKTPLLPGNVFTVEPGIYLPGRGGVRIEDDVVITTSGHLSLTSLPRELRQVG